MGRNPIESRKMLSLTLLLYTIYSGALIGLIRDSNNVMWYTCIIVTFLVTSWVVVLTNRYEFKTCAIVISSFMAVTLVLIGLSFKHIEDLAPVMCTFLIIVSMYGEKRISFYFPISFYILFVYHGVVTGNFKLIEDGNFTGLAEVINVTIFSFFVSFWNMKRDENMHRLFKVIDERVEAEKTKDDFIANISHELRTPLNTITGMCDMLIDKDLDAESKEKVTYINMAGKNLSSLVGNILDFSELQKGNIALEEEQYNFTSTVNDVASIAMAKIQEKRIEMVVDCAADMPSVLYGDEKKIRRVILNIIDNAIKFTEEGFVILKFSYRKEEYGINLIVEISDSGIGMSEEDLGQVFNRFNQVDTKRNRKNAGAGLGLSISKVLMQTLGGVINISSKPQKGTTVKLSIPQKVVDESKIVEISEDERKQLNLGLYVNIEEFIGQELRDAYQKSIINMVNQVDIKCHICLNLSELKRRNENEKFTHMFVSIAEYKEDREYFDEISKKTYVVVVLRKEEEIEITNKRLLKLFRPFYVLPIVSLIRGVARSKSAEEFNGDTGNIVNKKFKSNAKVLVVDDNKMNLMVAKGILEKYGVSVTLAESGREGIEILSKNDFDIIFLDHMMPEMDGVETLENIRNKGGMYYQNIPIVALTANASAGARAKFLNYGFNDFLEKPIEVSVLERVLVRMLPDSKLQYIETGAVTVDHNSETIETADNTEERNKEKNAGEGNKPNGDKKDNKANKEDEKKVGKSEEISDKKVEKSTDSSTNEVGDKITDNNDNKLVIGDLDVEKGLMYCGGESLYISILNSSVESLAKYENQLKQIIDDEDWSMYTIVVHGIKSSMLAIGATKLSEMAKKLEAAGKATDLEYIKANHGDLITEIKRVLHVLLNHELITTTIEEEKPVEEINSDELKNISIEEFEDYVNAFDDKVDDFDEAGMLEILGKLESCKCNDKILKNDIQVLIKKVEGAEYMTASDMLRDIMGGV